MRYIFFKAITLLSLSATTIACPSAEKGPAEKAGEQIDEAAENVKDAFKKDGPLEKAGEKIDEAADDAKEAIENAGE